MSRRIGIACVVVGLVVALIAWRAWPRETSHVDRPRAVATTVAGDATPPRSLDRAAKPQGAPAVRRLSPDDHRQLAATIAAARARARASAAAAAGPGTPGGAAFDDTITLEQVSGTVKQALEAAIPILAECYETAAGDAASGRTAAVQMTLTSDPDNGTVIDADAMRDEHGRPLDPKLDDCLRTTMESLGLPPLEVGGTLPLQYSFIFD